MCGRYTLHSSKEKLNQYYGTDTDADLKPRYNISPSTYCPIVRLNQDKRELAICKWGLIPHWIKADSKLKLKPINAKAETVREKPYFRSAFKNHRCLIPANGYYEWKGEAGKKQPYYIYPSDDEFFTFAGFWESWDGPDKTIETFTIITTSANKKASFIHDRMPVILSKDNFDVWISEGDQALLMPCNENMIEMSKVSSLVNKPGNDGESLIIAI